MVRFFRVSISEDRSSRTPQGGKGIATGVFINGREIHPEEYFYLLALTGTVVPGRYWLDATLTGGFESGPALFNLVVLAQAATGGPGYNRHTLFGGVMSDGACSGFLHPSRASVMTGNC
ncbi:MAG: hypothetical protein VYE68_07070 [Acidobacteriota bacterium]|nr:hypothetical protein [Acidobacteriota bacterium]